MKLYLPCLIVLTAIYATGCQQTECPGMDQYVADYIPDKTKLTYVSNTGKSFTLDAEKFITEDYDYISLCESCRCRKGAKVLGYTFDETGNEYFILYHILDDIYQPNAGLYQEDDYFQLEFDFHAYASELQQREFIGYGSYKINFKEGIFQNIYDAENGYCKIVTDTMIDNRSYQNVMIISREIDANYDDQIWKLVFAKNYGFAKFYVSNGEEWTLQSLE